MALAIARPNRSSVGGLGPSLFVSSAFLPQIPLQSSPDIRIRRRVDMAADRGADAASFEGMTCLDLPKFASQWVDGMKSISDNLLMLVNNTGDFFNAAASQLIIGTICFVVRFGTTKRAAELKLFKEDPHNFHILSLIFNRFARLQSIKCTVAGKNLYMRFSCTTEDNLWNETKILIDAEYAYSIRANEKSDIFSFDVVILELVTRKRPIDLEYGEKDLVKRVSTTLNQEEIDHIIDPNLGSYHKEDLQGNQHRSSLHKSSSYKSAFEAKCG
ncbi:hypothetical protein Scep_011977 [Stephania cephalantha]|uniref:Uncharacterized protein n=1 Tax=Stephania cephalantha TaxID=152367 RepID=A0AAP0JEA7_9MAGN